MIQTAVHYFLSEVQRVLADPSAAERATIVLLLAFLLVMLLIENYRAERDMREIMRRRRREEKISPSERWLP